MKRVLAALAALAILTVVSVVIAQIPAGQTSSPKSAQVATPGAYTTTSATGTADNPHAQAQPDNASSSSNDTPDKPAQGMSAPSSSGDTARMPKTASPYPLIAFVGLAALGMGAVFAIRRRLAGAIPAAPH